jgi:glycosyltransferase involved in cell wall biosynthesis
MSSAVRIAVAPSAYLVERLRANGWRDVRHQPYFVDLPPRPEAPRGEHELLYVGRLEPEKGLVVLLDALPEILAAFPRARLTLLGDGSHTATLRHHAARLAPRSAVQFLSKLPREQVAAHYVSSTVCILPSVWTENSPLVAYECLATGLPMIGSRIGGIPELIEDGCGFTFVPRDPQDLARTVVRFLQLPAAERERMSRAAIARARAFDRERHVRAIEGMYSEILASASPGGQAVIDSELLSTLHHLALETGDRQHGSRSINLIRALARSLGLPKILKS